MEKPSARRQTARKSETVPTKMRQSLDVDIVRGSINNDIEEKIDNILKHLTENTRKLDTIIEFLTKTNDTDIEDSKLTACPCAMIRGNIMGNAYITCSSSYRESSMCSYDGTDYKNCEIYRKTML